MSATSPLFDQFQWLKKLFTIFRYQYLIIHLLRAPAETSRKRKILEFEFFIKGDEHYKI